MSDFFVAWLIVISLALAFVAAAWMFSDDSTDDSDDWYNW